MRRATSRERARWARRMACRHLTLEERRTILRLCQGKVTAVEIARNVVREVKQSC